jgi:hypothetical protein
MNNKPDRKFLFLFVPIFLPYYLESNLELLFSFHNQKLKNMKKNLKFLVFTISVSLFTVSCSTYKNSYRLTDVPDNKAIVTQIVVDVEPDFTKRIKGESLPRRRSVTEAKNNAYYNAIKENNVDVLVDPIYEIKSTKGLFGVRHKAFVTAFVGNYKNSRSLAVENQNNFNQNFENLKKFLTLDAITKEDSKSVYILNNAGGCGTGTSNSVTEKEVRNTPDLISRYNRFLSGENSTSLTSGEYKETLLEEPKKKGFFARLFGK